MYVKKEIDTDRSLCIEKVLEDIPGGGTVAQVDFQTDTEEMLEGALVGVDSNGLYHIFKTAALYEDELDTETAYKVLKGHEFVVGDFLVDSGLAGASYAITEIDTANENYDVITVGTTLGHAMLAGECLLQATDEQTAGNATLKYTLKGIALNQVDLTDDYDNLGCGIMVRGTVNESLLPYYVDDNVKAMGVLALIRFV